MQQAASDTELLTCRIKKEAVIASTQKDKHLSMLLFSSNQDKREMFRIDLARTWLHLDQLMLMALSSSRDTNNNMCTVLL